MKELTFKEVMANIKEGEKWVCADENFNINYIEKSSNSTRFITKELCAGFVISDDLKFIKEQQPVTFEEVLNSDKKCRVEHELININAKILAAEAITEEWKMYCNGGYLGLGSMLTLIGYKYTKDVNKIIKEGKWYIEE